MSNYNAYYTNQQPPQQTNYSSPNAPPPPPYYQQNSPQQFFTVPISREERFQEIIRRHEISQFFANKLQVLSTYKIVFIFDDSGSMNTIIEDSPLNNGVFKATRWDELRCFSKISLDIANIFNQNGTDIYFLNRPPCRNITNADQLTDIFHNKPSGYTPLSRVLGSVLNENSNVYLGENKLLIIIVTDGEPTDDHGRVSISEFRKTLTNRHKNVYTTIVSCTDDDKTMDYLDNWDKNIPRLDVVDDFRNERDQIIRAQGSHFRFSFGDYIVKSLVGSIHTDLDRLDEVSSEECCIIL
jgi:hypothetical protein